MQQASAKVKFKGGEEIDNGELLYQTDEVAESS